MHRTVAAALVAALALALASCGSGEKTETVSRAQLVHRLDAACVAAQRQARTQMRGRSGQTAFAEAIRATLQTVEDRVGNLDTAGSARADFKSYLATVRVRIDALERILSADAADQQGLIARERDVIGPAGSRAHELVVRLGADHICL
jgi:hypothetical protein